MIGAAEAKQLANTYHNRTMDKVLELEMAIREESAKGKYKLVFPWKDITDAYGTNSLTQKHQRVLFELTKANYKMEFDCVEGNLILKW